MSAPVGGPWCACAPPAVRLMPIAPERTVTPAVQPDGVARHRLPGRHSRAWPAGPAVVMLAPCPAAATGLGGWPLSNPYTVFVVSALIVAGWLAVFWLLTAGRRGR